MFSVHNMHRRWMPTLLPAIELMDSIYLQYDLIDRALRLFPGILKSITYLCKQFHAHMTANDVVNAGEPRIGSKSLVS